MMNITVQAITNGKWRENCYVVFNGHREALVIDPGGGANVISDFVKSERLRVLAILNTHAHYDHVSAVKAIQDEYSVPFYLHSKDLPLLERANLYRKVFDGADAISLPTVDCLFDQAETPIRMKHFSISVLFTPGHTEGGVCLLIEDRLFTGDTLLKGAIGRVDLPGGDKEALASSLEALSKLPTEIKLYPGHGKTTNISQEIQDNAEFSQAIR